jgi:cyclomaltodextrinase
MPSNQTPFNVFQKQVKWRILTAILAVVTLFVGVVWQGRSSEQAPFGTGPGAWPVTGGVYEVSPEYFPNHSLNEITARIPTLQKLGITVLYITPFFQCVSTTQYLILDYYAISPRYGTNEDLTKLVKVAHQHGIKVLLDFVTSLTPEGSDIWKNHPEWLMHGKDGKVAGYYPFPQWGWALDGANPQLIEYFSKVARYYVEKFDTDGWRIDSPMNNYNPELVSGDHSRMELFRSVKRAIVSVKKDALMIAEISGPEVAWNKDDTKAKPLYDEMCEATQNYDSCGFLGGQEKSGCAYVMFNGAPGITPMHPTILSKVANNQATSKEFVDAIKSQRNLYDRLRANFIEDHDTARVSSCFPKQHRSLFTLIMSMPGVPVVHAGQEIGSTVHPDASGNTNVVVDWSKGDLSLQSFYESVLKARAGNKALYAGDFEDVWKSGDRSIAYLRSVGTSRVVVALNFDSKPAHLTVAIPLQTHGLAADRKYKVQDELTGESSVRQGNQLENLELTLPPYGQQVLAISNQ